MNEVGWVKLHRTIRNSWMWSVREPFDKRSAWLDMLMSAFFEDGEQTFKGVKISVGRGQFPTSVRLLADRWLWSTAKVNRYLERLKKEQMIVTERIKIDTPTDTPCEEKAKQERNTNRNSVRNTYGTLITIVNYGFYQNDGNIIDTPTDTPCEEKAKQERNTTRKKSETRAKHIKRNKEEKEGNKDNTLCKADAHALFEKVWKLYPVKKGKGQVSLAARQRLLKVDYDELVRAIDRYKIELEKDSEWRKPQNGSTFFNSGYVDYLDANYVPGEVSKPKQKKNQFNSFPQRQMSKTQMNGLEKKLLRR